MSRFPERGVSTRRPASKLVASYRSKLRESGIPIRAAEATYGFRLLDARKAKALAPNVGDRGGFVIPYFDAAGKPVAGMWRFRYLDPPAGLDARRRKPPKYTQPADTPPVAYFPPEPLDPDGRPTTWREIAVETAWPVVVTEGELKAIAATRAGFRTLGLGGVWNFRRDGTFLPELDRFSWVDREVFLVFDSDVRTKAPVRAALSTLAKELVDRGALLSEVVLPDLGDGKTGLDDYLVALGPDAFRELLAAAEPWERGAELHRLNREVAYVVDPGLVVRLDTRQRLTPDAFRGHAFSNRWFTEVTPGGRSVKKRAAAAWLDWPLRAEYASFAYEPGEAETTAAGALNVWPGWGVEPVEGDVGPWRELLDHLFGDDAAARSWFEAWAAYPVAYPGAKLLTAVLLWSTTQGTGKSLCAYTLGRVYGDANFAEIGARDLHSPFTAWAREKQLVLVDEVKGDDKRADTEALKRLITQQTLVVNEKYQPPYRLRDTVNYFLTSNHPDALLLEAGDRRFFVHEVLAPPLPPGWGARFVDWRDRRGGAEALAFHLRHRVAFDAFDPSGRAPESKAKLDMLAVTTSDVEAFAERLAADPDRELPAPGCDLWPVHDLLDLYRARGGDPRTSARALGAALRRAGFEIVADAKLSLDGRPRATYRFYAVRNAAKWRKASNDEAKEHYARNRLPPVGGDGGGARVKKF